MSLALRIILTREYNQMKIKTPFRPAGQSGKDLRTVLENRPITIIGAPFPLAAKEIERQGFPAVYLSGAALSAGLLGIPDTGLIPFETLDLIRT